MRSVRKVATTQLKALTQQMFASADDALFEMADRSSNDSDHQMYFEAMRQFRLQRNLIGSGFLRVFGEGFERMTDPALIDAPMAPSDEDPDLDSTIDTLSLMRNDDLEVSVAISGISTKTTSSFSLPIMQLTKRIDSLYPSIEVTERTNPLGPHNITYAFAEAIEPLELDIKVRIIVLKLFERSVMERLANVYADANKLLKEAGVLPNLRQVLRKARAAASKRAKTGNKDDKTSGAANETDTWGGGFGNASGGAASGGLGSGGSGLSGHGGLSGDGGPMAGSAEFEFQALQSLLAQNHQDGDASIIPDGEVISTPEIMTALSRIQIEDAEHISLDTIPSLDLRQLVITEAKTDDASHLSRSDDDVVNLVSMLFDYILNDRNLAIPMKALIGRLQIPILKVALLDKTFFAKTSHPARQLLNELSSAGIGWSSTKELKRDALYNLIESIVLRVLNEFTDDVEQLTDLVTELREYVARDHRRNNQIERRVKENESGKARTSSAKSVVQNLINQKAAGLRLPQDIGRFISDIWSRVLVLVNVKHGADTDEWTRMAGTLDELLWTVQPLSDLADIEKRQKALPQLLDRIEEGMAYINLPPSDVEQHIDRLSEVFDEVNRNDREFLDDECDEDFEPQEYEPLEEIVLTAPVDYEVLTETPEDGYLDQIDQLQEGVWVELIADTAERFRCKLSTIIPPDQYIFVNRRGMKVAARSRASLAIALKHAEMIILEESQVFDRALTAVIGSLRQLQRDTGVRA